MTAISLETAELNAGSGGENLLYDDVGGNVCPVSKIVVGGDGVVDGSIDTNTGNASSTTIRVVVASNQPAIAVTMNIGNTVDAAAAGDDDGLVMLAVRDDALSTITPADGDYTQLLVNSKGQLHVYDTDAITALQIMDDWDESDRCKVNLIAGQAGIAAGAGAVGATVPRVTHASDDPVTTAIQLLDNAVVDHGAAAVAGVRPVGLEGRSSDGTAVDSGDAVRALATLLGKQVTVPYAIPASTWSYAGVSGGITDTSDDVAKAAGAAGVRHYVSSVDVVNAHASVSTEVVIKDGSTVIWRGYARAAGGGVSVEFKPPLRGTAATAVNVTNITTGAQTYFNVRGFSAAE